jgi:hypothetical protein
MDRHHASEDLPVPSRPAPGRAALLRHLRVVEDLERMPPRTLRDVSGVDDWDGREVDRLARLAGGIDALEALDSAPLPASEAFDFDAIDPSDAPAVQSVLDVLHQFRPPYFDMVSRAGSAYTPPWLHDEFVTIVHRLVARAARSGVRQWHQERRRMAAAFVWLALGGNRAMGRGCAISAQDIWRWYDVSDCRSLARRLCVNAQLGTLYEDKAPRMSGLHVVFGDGDLLHSSFRATLSRSRDGLARAIADIDQRRCSQRPVQLVGEGQIQFKSRQARPLWAFKAPSTTGRTAVMVALGQSTDDDDYELIGFSVPDARVLLRLVQDAVDAPSTSGTMTGARTDRTPP